VLTPAGSLADLWTTRSGNRLNTTRVENRTTQFASLTAYHQQWRDYCDRDCCERPIENCYCGDRKL